MKRTNSIFVVARLMLIVLTLAITVFSFASCEGLPPELQGLLGGNPNTSCEHEYDNKCDFTCNKCNSGDRIVSPFHYYDNDCDTDCNECGATRETSHAYDNACDTACNSCGATHEITHTYANGVCSVCGAADESIPACQHTNVENCVCKDCGASAHSDLQWHAAFPPTCIINGSNTDLYFCSDCGKAFMDEDGTIEAIHEDVVILAQGHNYVNGICDKCGESNCKHSNIENCVCKDCGATAHYYLPLLDMPMFMPASDPTCDKNGFIEHYFCMGCCKSFSDEEGKNILENTVIPALGHNYVDGACDRCGAIECKHTTVENCVCKDCNEAVHINAECIVPTMAPTCGDYGYRCDVYCCNDCEKLFSDEACKNEINEDNIGIVIIPALGHITVGGICERCGRYNNGGESGSPSDPTPWQSANSYLYDLYRADNKKATPSDYELISKVVIEGEEFAVTWTIANESITLTYDETKGVYVVDIPDEVAKNCYYSIEATIHNSETGRSAKHLFVRLLEATVTDDGDDATECQHKNVEHIAPYADVNCEIYNALFDMYVCCDCVKVFYDAECKNEVPVDTNVSYYPGGHKKVGGICEVCGNPYTHDGMGMPSHPANPTPLESAYFYLIDLYPHGIEPTPSDYELVSKITIDGEEFAVTWTVANESITVSYDADKDAYVVNVPDEVNEKCYYTITATISDGEGNSYSFTFARVLMPSEE